MTISLKKYSQNKDFTSRPMSHKDSRLTEIQYCEITAMKTIYPVLNGKKPRHSEKLERVVKNTAIDEV